MVDAPVTRGELLNRAASLGARAVQAREAAERMPHRKESHRVAWVAALADAEALLLEADAAWARARVAPARAPAVASPVDALVARLGPGAYLEITGRPLAKLWWVQWTLIDDAAYPLEEVEAETLEEAVAAALVKIGPRP